MYYTHWNSVKPFLPEPLITYAGRSAIDGLYPYRPFSFASAPLEAPILESRTVFYTPTPSASASPGRIEKEVMTLFAAYSYLAEAAHQRHHPSEEFVVTRRYSSLIELLIVDETNRLKDVGLEQIRDIADRGDIGLLLLGMPGLDKRLQRVPQLYSRVGFAQKTLPLSEQETRFFLAQRWSHRVSAHSTDFTDQEAVGAIIRITQGNLRLIDRLMRAGRTSADREPAHGGDQRSRGDGAPESHHWLRMSRLKTLGLLRKKKSPCVCKEIWVAVS
jgi:hypothetical protein